MKDDDLHDVLSKWQFDVPVPQAFRRQVWERIERQRRSDGFFNSFMALFARPQIASVAAALSVLAGAWIGISMANRDGQAAYLLAVDPYAQVFAR